MRFCESGVIGRVDIVLNKMRLEQVEEFRCSGTGIEVVGSTEVQMNHVVAEGGKVLRTLRGVWKKRDLLTLMFEGTDMSAVCMAARRW